MATYAPKYTLINWERLTIYEFDTIADVEVKSLIDVKELLGALLKEQERREADEQKRQGYED